MLKIPEVIQVFFFNLAIMNKLKVVFMGTPEFAVASLKAIVDEGFEVAGVVTVPDKPAGRGLQLKQSPVKEYALAQGLTVLQPEKLKDPLFIEQLTSLKCDVQVVVAFRMLPEIVWNMPPKGTFNLHASLLPQYRGAAPINHAIINGEKETGVTTFFLDKEIDTGKIIFAEKVIINEKEDAGSLHDRLMETGSGLVIRTLKAIENDEIVPVEQNTVVSDISALKKAPKIFKEDCEIDWNNPSQQIFNLIRGLSPYPASFTAIHGPEGKSFQLKIFNASLVKNENSGNAGEIRTDGKKYLLVASGDGFLSLETVQLEGKKKMGIEEFLRGFHLNDNWKTLKK